MVLKVDDFSTFTFFQAAQDISWKAVQARRF
jgi:hypothetical protein